MFLLQEIQITRFLTFKLNIKRCISRLSFKPPFVFLQFDMKNDKEDLFYTKGALSFFHQEILNMDIGQK